METAFAVFLVVGAVAVFIWLCLAAVSLVIGLVLGLVALIAYVRNRKENRRR